jgi:hypothetical protein
MQSKKREVFKMSEENRTPFDENKSIYNLSARITREAHEKLEIAWGYLQTENNKSKFPKQSAVNEIILIGANTICKQFESNEITEEKQPEKSFSSNKSRKEQLYNKLNSLLKG